MMCLDCLFSIDFDIGYSNHVLFGDLMNETEFEFL